MLQVAKEDAQDTKGIAILLVMNKLSFERTRVHSSLTQLLKVFPVKVAAIHIVRQPARLGARFFDEKVVPTLKSLFRSVNAAIHAHSGTPDCDLRKIMARFDFDSENLPRSLGGGWTYQDFSQWLGQRLIMEQTSSLQPNLKTTLGESSQNGASSVLAMQPQAQLTTMFNKAQIDTECLLQSVLADHAMRLTRQSCDQSHHLYTTDQTLTQLLEINRIQHEGGSGQIDASSVEWNSGRLTANVQAQRSVAESASTINAGGPSPMTHRWLNGLANSVPASPNVNARRWEEMSSLN